MSCDEKFRNIAAGLQSIATMIAIIVGGWWTLHTFWALDSVQKAHVDIAAVEKSTFEQPVLQIELQASQTSPGSSGPRQVIISAKFKNDGKRLLQFDPPELDVYQLGANANGSVTGKKILRAIAQYGDKGELKDMAPRLLRSEQARTIAFVIDVPTAGNYLLELTTTYYGSDVLDDKSKKPDQNSSEGTSPPSDDKISAIEQLALIVP